jgi:hypothetical protein
LERSSQSFEGVEASPGNLQPLPMIAIGSGDMMNFRVWTFETTVKWPITGEDLILDIDFVNNRKVRRELWVLERGIWGL